MALARAHCRKPACQRRGAPAGLGKPAKTGPLRRRSPGLTRCRAIRTSAPSSCSASATPSSGAGSFGRRPACRRTRPGCSAAAAPRRPRTRAARRRRRCGSGGWGPARARRPGGWGTPRPAIAKRARTPARARASFPHRRARRTSSETNQRTRTRTLPADSLRRYERDVDPPASPALAYVRDAMGPLGYAHLLALGSVDGLVEASRQSRVRGGRYKNGSSPGRVAVWVGRQCRGRVAVQRGAVETWLSRC